jgi:NAD(P)-dependent dehydrogenase (short-subunit alcohol dehydrogenase family)
VARWESVCQATDDTIKRLGRVDILVNNAGIGGERKPVAEADPALWAQTINVDLTGQFYCMRAVLPGMIRQEREDRQCDGGPERATRIRATVPMPPPKPRWCASRDGGSGGA